MILIEDVLKLHELSIQMYGGSYGIRDRGLLESAIARPFQSFGGEDLYPNPVEKAAALGESLIINHPFIDGNKRTGLLGIATFLLENGIEITSSEDNFFAFIIAISTGELKFEQIVDWITANSNRL